MQIREIIVDGFGILINKRIKGLRPGINVIYGPNEFGKTSLLEFIRRILFGFPTKANKKNQYEPVNGAPCSGQLICELKSGEQVAVRRIQGANKGPVTLSFKGKNQGDASELDDLLGSATREMYENVYAFSLDELQSMQSLHGDEIKSRIYGAGMGLGTVSLSEVEKNFKKQCENIFKPKGSNQPANKLGKELREIQKKIRETEKETDQYESRSTLLKELEGKNIELTAEIESIEKKLRKLQIQSELYPVAAELIHANEELESAPDFSRFPEGGLAKLETLKKDKEAFKNRLQEEQIALDNLDRELKSVSPDKALLENKHDLIYIQQSAEKVRSADKDLPSVKNEKGSLNAKIQDKISKINPDWEETNVERFQLSSSDLSLIDQFHESLESLRQKSIDSQNKLSLHQERRDEEKSQQGSAAPGWLKLFTYVLMALSGAMAFFGFWLANAVLIAFAVIMAGMGLFLFFFTKSKGGDFKKEDALRKNYEANCKANSLEFSQKKDEWRNWLNEKNLSEDLTPLKAREIGDRADEIKNMLSERNRLDQRIKEMSSTLEEAKDKIEKIASLIPGHSLSANLPANIEIFSARFEENKAAHQKSLLFEKQFENQLAKISNLKQDFLNKESEIAQLIESASVKDESEFREQHEKIEKKTALKSKMDHLESQIKARVGMGDAYNAFMETIVRINPSDAAAEMEQAGFRLDELKNNRDRLLENIGETRQMLEQIENSDGLIDQRNLWERDRQTLNDMARDWATHKIALYMLDEAKAIYEKNRQPGVIRSAKSIFDQITSHRYEGIFKPADQDDIIIETKDGRQKGFLKMSRGAREQLYLSMRLGLIEEYETRSKPLPIIMDDVFVNFDGERAREVIKVLSDFAKDRQVILMTCHEWTAEHLLSAGAHMIELEENAQR